MRFLVCFKRAGYLQLDTALDLIGYLPLETHIVPLLQGLGYLETFYQMVEKRNEVELVKNLAVRRDESNCMMVFYAGVDVKCRWRFCWAVLQTYILRFFRAVIDQQTWTDDGSVSERRLRSAILSLACRLDDPQCVDQARQLFKDWLWSNGTLKYARPNCVKHICVFYELTAGCCWYTPILLRRR